MNEFDTDFEENRNSWNIASSVLYIVENYGWHLLAISVILAVLYHRVLKSHLQKYRENKFEKEYAAKYHKNPDVFAAHMNAQQQWIEKMQDKYDKESEEYQKKIKEKEEKKKQELMEKYGSSGGYVLGTRKDDKNNGLRDDYNPLMGSGSSSTYRPQRKSPCGGGGCGR